MGCGADVDCIEISAAEKNEISAELAQRKFCGYFIFTERQVSIPDKLTYIIEAYIMTFEKKYRRQYTKEEKIMTLKEGNNGHTYVVENIKIELNIERRLEALGLTESSRITVLNNDKKGAMTVKFRGTRFALGKHIADGIIVKEDAV